MYRPWIGLTACQRTTQLRLPAIAERWSHHRIGDVGPCPSRLPPIPNGASRWRSVGAICARGTSRNHSIVRRLCLLKQAMHDVSRMLERGEDRPKAPCTADLLCCAVRRASQLGRHNLERAQKIAEEWNELRDIMTTARKSQLWGSWIRRVKDLGMMC